MIEGTRVKSELESTVGRWAYVSCHCMVSVRSGVTADITYECGACGNTNLRFIHTVENMDSEQLIEVGIECAALLVGIEDCDLPRLAENETRRKERWRREVFRRPGRCITTVEDLEKRGKL